MFKAVRVSILLLLLLFVSMGSWLTQSRSTDWNNSLWVKVYPINGDGSDESGRYIDNLEIDDFVAIEDFIAQETARYGHDLQRPVRMELGRPVLQQPPELAPGAGVVGIAEWSLRLRWWAGRITSDQDEVAPDVKIFVRYHAPRDDYPLENSVGMQKGMIGIVNAFAGRHHGSINNVVIAHEFLHTLGATDKYDPASGLPDFPHGYADPQRAPPLPQRHAEIMGGRIAVSESEALIPKSLHFVVIGTQTAREIRLSD
ncbi:MAG: hypothetical protein WDZ50_02300 [Woeseia sp.]